VRDTKLAAGDEPSDDPVAAVRSARMDRAVPAGDALVAGVSGGARQTRFSHSPDTA
jgi:hypothetical protein